MDRSKVIVFLDPGHTEFTPGKCSPDKRLREYAYVREIVSMIESRLDSLGIQHWNTHPETGWVDSLHKTDSKDLVLRANRVKSKYAQVKAKGQSAFLVSVHVNAAKNGPWATGRGWSVWTTKGQNNSDKFAECLWVAANEILGKDMTYTKTFAGQSIQKPMRADLADGDHDYESDFYIIKQAPCVAVLTENLFQDNKQDVDYLLSEEGKKNIAELHVQGILKWIDKL
jgi:N-acetylmuramoyl-L-alanine amidase